MSLQIDSRIRIWSNSVCDECKLGVLLSDVREHLKHLIFILT